MDHWFVIVFWITLGLLLSLVAYECIPFGFTEGFTGTVGMGDSKFWARLVPRRGDVGPEQEQDGYKRDDHYFSGYVDVQRFGTSTDFCRMVQKGTNIKDKFIACALGGTENLTSVGFRTASVKDGFRLSRDDYMRDIDSDGRADYCRILKEGEEFYALCNTATDSGFSKKEAIDTSPPEDIEKLLHMYQGCIFWLRLRDDMLDYIQNLHVSKAGRCEVEEDPPRPPVTLGLPLNGVNQFLRIGDDSYLNFGSTVLLRNMRALQFWVKFDEFTNNAHILDFGNGAGIDNVWVGILNRGNLGIDATQKPLLCGGDSVVPEAPSGAQPGEVTTPQDLMETTSANVEAYTCQGFAVSPRKVEHSVVGKPKVHKEYKKNADMCYEIWDSQQRKMRIVVPGVFEIDEWVHVVITAEGSDAFRPDIVVYKNGQRIFIEPSGWLPQNNTTTNNYIGKSNWTSVTSQYGNRDELFKGSVFDIRGYRVPMSSALVTESYNWGKGMLGI